MAINLTSYDHIATGLFVRIPVDYYKSNANATPTSTVLRFSDYIHPVTINSESYVGLGKFVGISGSSSELKNSTGDITITLSGIPSGSIDEIVNSRIKGCSVQVWRVIFNSVTLQPLSISGNPVGRFFGIIDNYTLDEEYDIDNMTATNTISLTCSSTVGMLQNKISGRKTNPTSWKAFNSTDISMDRVPSLVGANFNFGIK